MTTTFTGVGTALVTPFTGSGALDEPAVRRLARRQIDAGINFLVPCGTTGENPTLSDAERLRIVGRNHDGGPLGRQCHGLRHVERLQHVQQRRGERYRVSPWLRRQSHGHS